MSDITNHATYSTDTQVSHGAAATLQKGRVGELRSEHSYLALRKSVAARVKADPGRMRRSADGASEQRARPTLSGEMPFHMTDELVNALAEIGGEMAESILRRADEPVKEFTRQEIAHSVRYYEKLRGMPVSIQEDPGVWLYLTIATLGEALIAAGRIDEDTGTIVKRHLGLHSNQAGVVMARRMFTLGRLVVGNETLRDFLQDCRIDNYQEMVTSHVFTTSARYQPGFQAALIRHLADKRQDEGREHVAQNINPVRVTLTAEAYTTENAAEVISVVTESVSRQI